MATKSAESSKKPRGKAFEAGKSGNPGGRPKLPPEVKHVRELARQYTIEAIEALVASLTCESHSARVSAANTLLDRGWGKPEQTIIGDPSNPIPVEHILRPQLTKEEWLKAHGVGTATRSAG